MIGEPPRLTIVKGAPRPTEAQIAAFQGLETAHIVDAMGGSGAMGTEVGPIGFGRDLACNAAGPALVADSGPADIIATLAAVNLLTAGDVVVHAAHGNQDRATIGDQVSGLLRNAGAAGFVTDGPMRDYEGIVAAGLPAWCTGLNPNSPYTSGPGTLGGSAVVGGCHVATGDMIVADRNGVVVIPFARIDEVLEKVKEVQKLEAELVAKVRSGFRTPLDIEAMLADGSAVEIG